VVAVGGADGYDAGASARGVLSVPFGRAYGAGDGTDPWLHRVDPRLAVSALVARGDELLGYLPTLGAVRGAAWTAGTGIATSVGRWGKRDGLEAEGDVGVVGASSDVLPVIRWRAAANASLVGLGGEGAHVLGAGSGTALTARARVGRIDGLKVALLASGRDGVDPIVARALTDAPLEPSSGMLAADGWTGGARASIPLGPYVTTQAGADADLTRATLLAVRGAVELRERCRCVAVRAIAMARVGRPGVDVWVTIDLAPAR